MCIRDRPLTVATAKPAPVKAAIRSSNAVTRAPTEETKLESVSYTHLRAHETVLDLVCRLLLEKIKNTTDCQGDLMSNN